jgi:hypothetical protein
MSKVKFALSAVFAGLYTSVYGEPIFSFSIAVFSGAGVALGRGVGVGRGLGEWLGVGGARRDQRRIQRREDDRT